MPNTTEDWANHEFYNQIKGALFSQEFSVRAENITIWIDPLDATLEYTEGLTQYVTNMIGIAINGVPAIGILNSPFQNRTKIGFKYGSASLNLDIGEAKMKPEANNAYVSRSYWLRLSQSSRKNLQSLLNPLEVTPAGGAGYKAWKVIEGRFRPC